MRLSGFQLTSIGYARLGLCGVELRFLELDDVVSSCLTKEDAFNRVFDLENRVWRTGFAKVNV